MVQKEIQSIFVCSRKYNEGDCMLYTFNTIKHYLQLQAATVSLQLINTYALVIVS